MCVCVCVCVFACVREEKVIVSTSAESTLRFLNLECL